MRKFLNSALVALLAFGAISCSKEATIEDGLDTNTGEGMVFKISGINGGVTTYGANDVPASTTEKAVDAISVYVFEEEATASAGDGVLKLVKDFPGLSGQTSATLDMGLHPELTGRYVAYFVANNGSDAFIDMSGVVVGTTTEADFRNLPTKAVSKDVANTAFLMTAAYTTPIPSIGTYSGIELRRRVARFDLYNEAFGALTITKIEVQDANDQTNAFGQYTTAATPALVQPTAVSSFTGWTDVKDANDDTKTIAEELTSVFYLNPTVIPGSTGKTKIYLHAEDKDNNQYTYALTPATDFEIKPNYRYRLILTTEWKFNIALMEWDSEDDVNFIPGTGSFGIASAPVIQSNGTFNPTYNSIAITNPTQAFSADFAVRATSSKGVEVSVVSESGHVVVDESIITVTNPATETTVSYAAPYFKSTFTASFLADAIAADKNFRTALRVKDIASGESIDFILHYDESTEAILDKDGKEMVMYNTGAGYLPAVKVGNQYWAPVNVGGASIDDYGSYFQWGRKVGFKAGAVETIEGPLAILEANNSNKFILSSASNDWFTTEEFESRAFSSLWVKDRENSPCPSGWYVPNIQSYEVLISKINTSNISDGNKIGFEGDDGQYLYFPCSGTINRTTGVWANTTSTGVYWSVSNNNSANPTHHNMFWLRPNATPTARKYASERTNGFSVRCVKDAE